MTRVLVFGHSDNAIRIAELVDGIGDIRAAFVDEKGYLPLLAAPPRGEPIVLVRSGYRPGASTRRGRTFDAYWRVLRRRLPNARACYFWLGTDALNAVEEARAGTVRRAVFAAAREELHLAVAPWLVTELESVGLHAELALLPPPIPAPAVAPPLPAEFRVVTYLPGTRFEFHRGDIVLEVARLLPQVRFDVVGGHEEVPREPTGNVHWHGWVDDMAPLYADSTVVIRIPRHDGFGNTVIEGLLNARHVIYTQDVPHVRRVSPDPSAIATVLDELWRAHRGGSPELEGWLEFNRRRTGLKTRHVTTRIGSAELRAILYVDRLGRVVLPRNNPYLPVAFHSERSRPSGQTSDWHALVAPLVAEMRRRGTRNRLPLPPGIEDVRPWQWAGFLVGVGYTYVLDLPFVSSSAGRGVRRDMELATTEHMTVERVDDVGAVHQCLCETESRQTFSYSIDVRELSIARDLLGPDSLRMYVCFDQRGRPASTTIAIHAPGTAAIGWIGGTRSEYLKSGAGSLLFSEIFADLGAAGASGFDFCGANIEAVAHFKSHWNGRLTPTFSVRSYSSRTAARFAADWLAAIRLRGRTRAAAAHPAIQRRRATKGTGDRTVSSNGVEVARAEGGESIEGSSGDGARGAG